MVLMPINMPSNCYDCPCHEDYGVCLLLYDIDDNATDDYEYEYDYKRKCITGDRNLRKNRRENCPLVDVTVQEATGTTEDAIEKFRKLFIRGDWSN